MFLLNGVMHDTNLTLSYILLFLASLANKYVSLYPSRIHVYRTLKIINFLSRIRTERHGGAWCPQPQITKDVYEYLEIDLGEFKVISMVETQGRYGNGHVS